MVKLGRKPSKLQLIDLPKHIQLRVIQEYTIEKKSAVKIHQDLQREFGEIASHSIYSFLKHQGITRNRSDATRCLKFSVKRSCKHCDREFVIMNTAQVYCRTCCPTRRAYNRLKHYSLSHPEFKMMLEHQQGLCKLCDDVLIDGGSTNLNVDHCHQTGEIRGLLCHRCNMVVGFLDKGDWRSQLQRIASYIQKEI